jgi:S1-C subfamily serine protease
VVHAPGLAKARHSIVMIEGSSATCRAGEGSGFVFAPHHVLTNAHVVAGFPTIYGDGAVIRHVYPVRADIQPGNSGSPLLAPDGTVYGMVFAALTGTGDAGYAVAAGEVASAAQAAATRTRAASTQPWHCPA